MARLKAGVAPTPHKTRLEMYRVDLVARGGHRMIADLEPEAHQALRTIMARVEPPASQKAAVSEALISYAQAKPVKPAKRAK